MYHNLRLFLYFLHLKRKRMFLCTRSCSCGTFIELQFSSPWEKLVFFSPTDGSNSNALVLYFRELSSGEFISNLFTLLKWKHLASQVKRSTLNMEIFFFTFWLGKILQKVRIETEIAGAPRLVHYGTRISL